jgi:hypothetical protein
MVTWSSDSWAEVTSWHKSSHRCPVELRGGLLSAVLSTHHHCSRCRFIVHEEEICESSSQGMGGKVPTNVT